jgi:hypothetical protein
MLRKNEKGNKKPRLKNGRGDFMLLNKYSKQ